MGQHERRLAAQGVEHLADEARGLGLLLVGVLQVVAAHLAGQFRQEQSGYGIQPCMPGIRPMMQSWPGLISTAMGVNWLFHVGPSALRRTIQNASWLSSPGIASGPTVCRGTKLRPSLPQAVPPGCCRPVLKVRLVLVVFVWHPASVPAVGCAFLRGDELADPAGVGAAEADRELRVGPGWLEVILALQLHEDDSRVFP